MNLNAVYYQVLTPATLLQHNGQVTMNLVAIAPTLHEAMAVIVQKKLVKHVILCCVVLQSSIVSTLPDGGTTQGQKLNG